jgi:hypothetical protein
MILFLLSSFFFLTLPEFTYSSCNTNTKLYNAQSNFVATLKCVLRLASLR